MLNLTPINMAEAIFEPFWDPALSGLPEWQIDPGGAHGLEVSQNWCWVSLGWERRPADGLVLRMRRAFDMSCAGYDRLMISINLPAGAALSLLAETELGPRRLDAPPSPGAKKEYILELAGALRIIAVTLELRTAAQVPGAGWINWLGLQNSAQLERYLAQFERFSPEWAGYLKPADQPLSFEPAFGLLVDAAELDQMRAEFETHQAGAGESPLLAAARAARELAPERMIRDYVNFWGDTRYCRARDEGHLLLQHGPSAAVAGLLLRDPDLLRLAARYALSIAFCDTWDDGFICAFPGGTFDHRCFVQSRCAYETALILDLAGECFTDLGRDYLLRRIGEHAIGNINQITWAYEYIFHNNQLAWFTPGRILGYLALERFWPRLRPYVELARADLAESFEYTILPDGGYVEGPSYFECVASYGCSGLYHYARARGLDYAAVVPPAVLRSADFAAAMASTDDESDLVPICDGHAHISVETAAQMAALMPASAWVNIYHKVLARLGGFPDSVIAWQMARAIPPAGPDLPAFVYLPVMGAMSSQRRLGGAWVKLFLMGNQSGAGHTHEDKGSFILEFGGETYACDPGTCDYSHGDSIQLQQCERHNMLVPTGLAERPHPECPLFHDVHPRGSGDGAAFQAEIDLRPGWEPYYRRWTRRWESPAPDSLLIRDEYELARGSGVDFHWNTRLPVEIGSETVTLRGKHGRAVIDIPAGCTARLERLTIASDDFQNRLTFYREGQSGVLEIRVRLFASA
jgi:hypothetical protein